MRTDPLGGDVPIDEDLERGLVSAATDEFVRRFQNADKPTRASVLYTVLEVSDSDLETMVRERFVRLPRSTRVGLLKEIQNSE